MAYGDIFLKLKSARGGDVTGESNDAVHGGEIDLLGFSWGMKASSAMGASGPAARSSLDLLHITKEADRASTALMSVLRNNDAVTEAVLTVRKAGGVSALDYLVISIFDGRITSYELVSDPQQKNRLLESLSLSFQRIEVSYTGQDTTGGGMGSSSFSAETTA